MCRSSASEILRSSSFDHVLMYDLFATLLPILFIADLFHPFDRFPVELFLNRDVRHAGGRRGSVPVFLTRRNADDITCPNFLLGTAPLLDPAGTGRHDEDLAQGVCVPCSAST